MSHSLISVKVAKDVGTGEKFQYSNVMTPGWKKILGKYKVKRVKGERPVVLVYTQKAFDECYAIWEKSKGLFSICQYERERKLEDEIKTDALYSMEHIQYD